MRSWLSWEYLKVEPSLFVCSTVFHIAINLELRELRTPRVRCKTIGANVEPIVFIWNAVDRFLGVCFEFLMKCRKITFLKLQGHDIACLNDGVLAQTKKKQLKIKCSIKYRNR